MILNMRYYSRQTAAQEVTAQIQRTAAQVYTSVLQTEMLGSKVMLTDPSERAQAFLYLSSAALNYVAPHVLYLGNSGNFINKYTLARSISLSVSQQSSTGL
jgi:hypothetical protein